MDLETVLELLEDEKRQHNETKQKLQRCEDRLQTQKDYQTLYEEKLKTIRELEDDLAVRNSRISQLNLMKTEDTTTIIRMSDRIKHLETELNQIHQENFPSKIGKMFEALKNTREALKETHGYIEDLKSKRFSLEMKIHGMEKGKQPVVEKIPVPWNQSFDDDDDDDEEEEENDEEVLRKIFAAEPPRPTKPPVKVKPNPIPPVVRDPPIGSPSQMMESTFDPDVARVEIPGENPLYSSGEDALQRLLNERKVKKPILKKRNARFAGFATFEEQRESGSRKKVRFSM